MKRLDGVSCLPMTPFTAAGVFDEASMRRQIDHVAVDGIASIIALGRAGEVMYLTMAERAEIMDVVMDQVAGRQPVGFGCIDMTYDEGLAMGRLARDVGADFVMSRGPVDGDILEYYRRLADIIPVVAYDVGTQRDLTVEGDLAPLVEETGNIIAVKFSGLPEQVTQAKTLMDISVLCGREAQAMLAYELGADGVTTVLGVLNPSTVAELDRHVKAGRWDEARELYYGVHLPLLNYLPGGPGLMGWSVIKNILTWEGIIDSPYVLPPSLSASEVRLGEARRLWQRI